MFFRTYSGLAREALSNARANQAENGGASMFNEVCRKCGCGGGQQGARLSVMMNERHVHNDRK